MAERDRENAAARHRRRDCIGRSVLRWRKLERVDFQRRIPDHERRRDRCRRQFSQCEGIRQPRIGSCSRLSARPKRRSHRRDRSREYEATASLASANVSAAKSSRANLTNQEALQRAAIVAATAQHDSALASLEQTRLEYERQQDLGQASTEQRLQQSHAAYLQAHASAESTTAAIEQQRAQLEVLRGQESLLDAQIAAQSASLATAELHREFTRIYAPFDGTVGKKSAHVGDYLSIGGNVVPIIPNEVYVTANFKETQLANMRIGQAAEVKLDTYPGTVLQGRVERMSPASGSTFALLPPDNATGNYTKVVQRIPVRIAIDDGQPLRDRLSPGLSATVTVDTRGQH